MTRIWLPTVSLAAIFLLSACDRLSSGSAAEGPGNSGSVTAFEAARSGQSLHVSHIIWLEIYSGGFSGRRGELKLEQTYGISGDEAKLISDFADDAKARMLEFQQASVDDLCAEGDSILTRWDAARAHTKLLDDANLFEKSLVLEFFELLGDEQALQVIQTVHQSRLDNRTPSVASVDPMVFHLLDERSPQEFVASLCRTRENFAASAANITG